MKYIYIIFFSILVTQESDSLNNNIVGDLKSSNMSVKDFILSSDSLEVEDLFEAQLYESKLLLAESIIADRTGDSIEAMYRFESLFESLSYLNAMKTSDQFQSLEMNRLLSTSIDYYENESNTLSNIEELSVSLLRDRLDKYIYSQTLEDLEYVDESIEVIQGHIPITYNRKVASIIKFFQKDGRKSMTKWLNRMDKYKKLILPILEEQDIPPEIFYVSVIESGLNPNAYSYAYASGLWQFIKSTGKAYGLNKTYWLDERRDYIKSTYAATKYFKDLYLEFDDWYLALAAYNCGSTRVHRAIKRNGSKNYWDLYSLPSETKNYVPNVMATIIIATNPEKYGFTINSEPDFEWIEKDIDKSVKLESIAKCANVSLKTLQQYNPELEKDVALIPPLEKGETYTLRLPVNISPEFDSLLKLVEAPNLNEIIFVEHKVRPGESVWLIARKYKVKKNHILAVNNLSEKSIIRPNQILKIPTSGYDQYKKSVELSSRKIYYTVRRGDTLSEIAEKYKTSIKKIKKSNGLRNDRIIMGQKLIIWVKN
ncbi:MAG: hypothetical protein CMG11_01965 [Candidatus Marinimicrobia bacterium]|nr:hypothetical protein [Candidatus Neomarinimicrobiota bacterium]|tara:strand:- start:8954 stop:10573 length:1620 start_codon:yes stop_codon:yes gene_type:complete